MKLEHILKSMEIVSILGPKDVEIKGLEYDSRNVKKDELFVELMWMDITLLNVQNKKEQ